MADERLCRTCGSELPSNSPDRDICPKCVINLAIEAQETHASDRPGATTAAETAPEQIGPYRILEPLGEGGMGIVYLAEQREPVRRRVALKLIKPGMDSKQVLARFESERQALAIMNHRSVAKVFDAGVSENGRPYFVMEYVQGVPITLHCDAHRYSLRDRLELFVQTCEAIQHAHQKGIIHRDIKPSNVLVSMEDGHPVAKVIDFGVAKAIDQRLTERTLFTQHGTLIGTPEYMSPEQAGTSHFAVDTRTDIYSLGVLLYELLVGALPFDSDSLRNAAALEMLRIIREDDPPRPATRISSLGDGVEEIARRRLTDPRSLARKLKGELDWITMRTLEKDPSRRYSSASELASDIRRYLREEPVLAGPPNATYRMRKFVHRHRLAVAAVGIVGLALTIGAAGLGVGLLRAIEAEEHARAEAERANLEAETADEVATFLSELFLASDPGSNRGETVTLREVLDRSAERIENELNDQPLVQSRLIHVIGGVYRGLGLYDRARPFHEQALQMRRELFGNDDPKTLDALNAMAGLEYFQGDFDAAKRLFSETVEIRRRVQGNEHPDTLAAMSNLTAVLVNQHQYEEAARLHAEILEVRRRVLGNRDKDTIISMNNLAGVYSGLGRLDEAMALYEESMVLQRDVMGPRHPATLRQMNGLAGIYRKQKLYDQAGQLYEELHLTECEVLGEEHPQTLGTKHQLCLLQFELGDYDEAATICEQVLETQRRVLGDDHPSTLYSIGNLGTIYATQGKDEVAEPLLVESLKGRREALGVEHPFTLNALKDMAEFYSDHGRPDEARALRQEVLQIEARLKEAEAAE
jgi:serine/threonine protein kinase/tetratricopeptide (TPR) repeat protein